MSQRMHVQNFMILLKRKVKHYVEKWLEILIWGKFSWNSTKHRSRVYTPNVYVVVVDEAEDCINYHLIAQAVPNCCYTRWSSHSWS